MPNAENINKTIELMRLNQQYTFDMSYFANELFDENDNVCGTSCCLAGFAYVAKTGETLDPYAWIDYRAVAEQFFDIDSDTGHALFLPENNAINLTDIETGIKALEHLRDTGEVLWNNGEYEVQDNDHA